jgi:hypothetical protein
MNLKDWLLGLSESDFLQIYNEMSVNVKVFRNLPEDHEQFLPGKAWELLRNYNLTYYKQTDAYCMLAETSNFLGLRSSNALFTLITDTDIDDMVEWVARHDDWLRWIMELGYRIEVNPGYYLIDDGNQLLIKFAPTNYVIGIGPEDNRNFHIENVRIYEQD